ncbi:CDP-diacylglycerol--serine O-phosphatidyltransferase [Denitrobaculum tricleocarpae]|uniref:CDP-diacylglycerol--serine O-phosphatidyltransferase n=1 Tax=Denitrobaculum tricleocarpae TaxID=2591009 RepID=A0A545T1X8_9PROT|nr:CDP-diacylglycerol--serine O-phosphatidyltransferase [Denitrobaculum tricleocarpae]TQV71238.1 CDP-diacylglycerol--serine O-phosphatidyltransferase [Denitrobaculum tricleocarpae]
MVRRRRRLRGLSINRLIPNAITLMGLCAGMTAIRWALEERWEVAVAAVVVAMVIDGLDGPVARLMKATSEFGAQLDSLADFVNFGVTPAIIVYLWAMHELGGLAWALALVYAMCCALRLARFNAGLNQEDAPAWSSKFFVGVPAPAGAGLMLLPMVLSFKLGDDIFRSQLLNGVVFIGVAALMVSQIPTYSSKRIKVPLRSVGFVLIGAGAFAAFLFSTPWVTLSVAGLAYLLSIPLAQISFRKMRSAMPEILEADAPDSENNDTDPSGPRPDEPGSR